MCLRGRKRESVGMSPCNQSLYVCVRVCVRERDTGRESEGKRESVCVCLDDIKVSMCVPLCVCVREREIQEERVRGKQRECVYVSMTSKSLCVCVCA